MSGQKALAETKPYLLGTVSQERAMETTCGPMPDKHARGLEQVSPSIREAQIAFQRALPGLLASHFRQWVAYHGNEQIGFAASKADLHAECLRHGIPRGQFLIRRVTPDSLGDYPVEASLDV